MSANRILILAKRVVRQFLRDRRSVAMLIFVPILIMTLLSFVVGLDVKNLKVGLYADGTSSLFSSEMVETLSDKLTIEEYFDAAEGIAKVKNRELDALLVLPNDFFEARADDKAGDIEIHMIGDNPARTASVFKELRDAMSGVLDGVAALMPEDCSDECAEAVNTKFPTLEEHYLQGNADLRIIDFHASFFATFFVFFFSFIFCSLAFFRERTQGTLERLLVGPMSPGELFLGYLLGFFAFGIFQGTLVVLFLIYVLKVYIVGSVALVFLAIAPTVLIAEALGIFISGFSKREFQVVQFIPIVVLPQVLLSNLFWPVHDFPIFVKQLALAMPLYHADQAARVVFFEGQGVTAMLPSLGVLLGMCAAMMILTSWAIRRGAA